LSAKSGRGAKISAGKRVRLIRAFANQTPHAGRRLGEEDPAKKEMEKGAKKGRAKNRAKNGPKPCCMRVFVKNRIKGVKIAWGLAEKEGGAVSKRGIPPVEFSHSGRE